MRYVIEIETTKELKDFDALIDFVKWFLQSRWNWQERVEVNKREEVCRMNGKGMFVLNGEANKGVEIISKYGLNLSESRTYFTLLVFGELQIPKLAKQSGTPQSKIYNTVKKLQKKRLVAIIEEFPKLAVALPFEMYLSEYIRKKYEEIEDLRESRRHLREVICKLQPVALKHSDKIQMLEPSYRRGLTSPAS